jgi:hypothetical protein
MQTTCKLTHASSSSLSLPRTGLGSSSSSEVLALLNLLVACGLVRTIHSTADCAKVGAQAGGR